MLRIFRHYVSLRLLVLGAAEAGVVFTSVVVWSRLDSAYQLHRSVPQAVALSLVMLLMLHVAQLYDASRGYGRRELLLRAALAFTGAYGVMAVLSYLIAPLRMPRSVFVLSSVVAFPAVFAARLAYGRLLRDARRRRRVLLLGASRPGQKIADTLNGLNPNYEMLGYLNGHPDHHDGSLERIKALGSTEDLAHVAKVARPDVIVVAMTDQRGSLPVSTILDCKLQGIEVDDWPSFYEKVAGKIPLTDLRPSWLIFSDGFRKSAVTMTVKRGMDVILGGIGFLLTVSAVPLIAALIKLDSRGPILVRQERVGLNGRVFTLCKFRSMVADAEAATGPVWARERDARVTGVGRILRRTRLDELPQLWNVIRGDMSLVGPRPERPAFVAQLQERIPFYGCRLSVKPGVTGWAQVRYGYGATVDDALEKLQYDFYYIKNLSIFLDLLILLNTLQVVLLAKGSR